MLRRRPGRRTGATAIGVAAGLTGLVAGSAFAAGTPGAPGIGDPYYPLDGNGGYDAGHYNIRLTYDPAGDRLRGTTTVLATATQDLSRFNLDFLLHTTEVRVNNARATFSQRDGELVVTPTAEIPKGASFTVTVRYDDVPTSYPADWALSGWRRTPTSTIGVGQPHIARWWYPSNDHPQDKATFDVSVAVPDGVEAISNGQLVDKQQQIDGWVRWNWRSAKPQTTYNTFLVVGDYEMRFASTPNGLPFVTAYETALDVNAASARASVERTPEVVELLETYLGGYPLDALGGVVSKGLAFGLETQTRPVYSDVFFKRGANTYIVTHLISEQWFGASVSLRNWHDNVLKEGFATYARYLWSEHEGEGTPAELTEYYYDRLPADDPFWAIKPADPTADEWYHDAVFYRGAMGLQALRTKVGDQVFFAILRGWVDVKKYGNASAADFVAYAEKVAGRQLDSVFDTWWYSAGKPAASPNGDRSGRAKAAPASVAKIDAATRLLARR